MHLCGVVQAPQHTNPLLRLQINVKEEFTRLNITVGTSLTKLLQANATRAPQVTTQAHTCKLLPGSSFLILNYSFHVGFECILSDIRLPCGKM
jgi:hypothetical protein